MDIGFGYRSHIEGDQATWVDGADVTLLNPGLIISSVQRSSERIAMLEGNALSLWRVALGKTMKLRNS